MEPSKRLRTYSSKAIEELRAQNFLDAVYAQEVFSEGERDDVRDLEGKREAQARKFMDIMAKKSDKQIETFFEILRTSPKDKQPQIYKIFFPIGASRQSGTAETPTADVQDVEVTSKQINEVSMAVRDKWRQIGSNLGFSRADLEEYRESKMADRLFSILSDWKRKVDRPTIRVLSEACEAAGVGGEVNKILGIRGK